MLNHVYSTPQEFKLKEKIMSMSGDSFKVVNSASGQTAFKVKGHAMSLLSEKKTVRDANGNDLYRITEAIISVRDRMFIEDSQSKEKVLSIRKKGFIPFVGTSTILCFRNDNEKKPYLSIKGNLFRKNFTITEVSSAKEVASVRRQSNMRSVLAEKDSYILRVEPGYDAALMCTLVICLDEQYRDDGTRSGVSALL